MADPQNKTFDLVGPDGTRYRFPVGIDPKRAAAIVRARKSGEATMGAAPEPNRPPSVTDSVVNFGKNVANFALSKPEETIELAAPAAGATLGGLTAGPPGAIIGAGLGWGYGKLNRASSNVATGKPVGTDLPKNPGEWGWSLVDDVATNAGPDAAIPGASNFLKARGIGLVSRAMRPSQATVNHMVEMGRRGALPMDVRSQGAKDLIDVANRHGNLAPVSDANIRSAVGDLWKHNDAVTDTVAAGAKAGDTLAMGPITGEAGGFAVHQARGVGGIGGSPTPSDKLPAIRNRIRAYQTDPESTLTKPFERVTFGGVEPGMGTPRPDTVEHLRVPNDKANTFDLLQKRRHLGGDLRGSWGLNPDNANAAIYDKAWYRKAGDDLKGMYPEAATNLEQEHRLMNAVGMALPQQYLQSQANPLNLYTFLGAASGQPEALALGLSNYPWVKSAMGKGLHNLGARLGGERAGKVMRFKTPPEMTAGIYRAALLARMGFTPDPEE